MATSQKDQIQSLIADIERALGKERPKTPWVKTSDTEPQREALARAQAYLMSLQQSFDAPGGWGPVDPSTGQIAAQPATPVVSAPASNASADNVLQALLTEMKFLKSSALEPLRLEMDSLREERDRLNAEVKTLAEQRNQAKLDTQEAQLARIQAESMPVVASEATSQSGSQAIDEDQLNQFLQVLMARIQENLSVQVTDTLSQLETEHSATMAKLTAATEIEILELKPTGQSTEQIEEMRQLQSRSDQLLANIDSTLQRMFETLQTNIDSYQISLNEGIDNMHSLGRQGEVIVRSLVDHLTQQLGQTTPPEPAFYPGSVNTLADATDFSVEPTADTVSSLNEILPAEILPATSNTAADVVVAEQIRSAAVSPSDSSQTQTNADTTPPATPEVVPEAPSVVPAVFPEAPVDNTAQLAEQLIAEGTDDAIDSSAEDFIREDGTIDLDLLKLDIDRTEDDPSLSRDDLMIDSAVADAQVAAQEVDLDIEEKVTPTANAAFLADLTFDDLVVDSEIVAQNADIEANADANADVSVENDTRGDADENVAPEPTLSAILPDLSFNDSDIDEDSDTAESSNAESSSAESSDAETATRGEPSVASEPEADETPEDTAGDTNEEKLESAFVPDPPEDDPLAELPSDEQDSKQPQDQTVTSNLMADEDIDAVLADDLIAVIAAANEEAERTAIETVDGDLDELTSDLEESVVFDADLPPLSVLGDAATPPESASIPDLPDSDVDPSTARDSEQTPVSETAQSVSEPTSDQSASTAPQFPPDAPQPDEIPIAAAISTQPTTDITQFPPTEALEASLTELESEGNTEVRSEDSSTEDSSTEDSSTEDSSTFDDLEDLINDDAANTELPANTVENKTVTELPPVDFDDDLDFFQTASPTADTPATEPAPERSPTEGDVAPIPELPNAAGIAGAVGAAAVAAGGLSQAAATSSVESEPVDQAVATPADQADAPVDISDAPYNQGPTNDEGDDDPTGGEPADWFLGIDFGATGLSAVLINQRGEQVYPLCWNVEGDSAANRFRLPTVVQLRAQPSDGYQLGQVGPVALQQSAPLLRNLKLMVKAGIPDNAANAPWMQWADHVALPLTSLQSSIVDLLKTLNSEQMSCQAVGITRNALRRALADLKGVVVGYPTNWPDTYSFNLREAVLSAGLVSSPEQVFFVEEAIAALLSALPAPKVANDIPENQQPGLYNCNWSGGTVVISAGAVLTETAVANLPDELEQLSYQDFAMRGYTYAGDGIDQDIICQLLHLPLQTQGTDDEPQDSAGTGNWASLGRDEIPLPQPGEADRVVRHRLRQRLNNSPLGREVVLAARELKVALQEEEEVEVELGNSTWIVTRQDLETKVFLPYIQRVNRQVNALLSKKDLAAQNIKQVVCTGGSASLGAIARWLRQKFPNATIIQDTYSGEYSNSCSRVAYGLANLCQYPKVLDSNRHQYNDYFLLLELLRILPEQPLPAGGILHLLEQRGINAQACQAHVLALIEGHLPPGLVPTSGDRPLISAQSSDIETYKALSELPLFRKQGGQIYIADPKQGERLRSHLETLLSTKAQSLGEPMTTESLTAAASV
ncbi:MAG: hypothetical protein ACFB0D_03385 [Phormidesmis sp.]